MTPFAISGLLIVLTCFPLAIWILVRAPKTLLNRLLIAFNIFVGIWGLGTLWAGLAKTHGEAIWAWRLAHVGGFPLGMTFFHIALVLSEAKSRRKVFFTYCFAVFSAALCVSGIAMRDTQWSFGSLHYYRANLAYVFIFVIWVAIVAIGHKRLFQAAQRAKGLQQTRLWVVFFAFATGFIGGISGLLPFIGIGPYPYGNFSIPVYTVILTYAIVKYDVTETRVVITRAGLLLGVYLIVLGAPFLLGWWGQSLFEQKFGKLWWFIPLGLCALLATVGPLAYAYLRRQAEERLLKEQRRYQRTLQRAARGMTQVRDLKRLARLIARVVHRSVRVTHASLFLWDKIAQRYVLQASYGAQHLALQSRYSLEPDHALVRWLVDRHKILAEEDLTLQTDTKVAREITKLGAALAIPGLIERRLIGFLVLGPKLSGTGYSSDDLHAFSTLAYEAAIALENAGSYEELLRVNEQLKAASQRLLFQERLAAAGQFAMGMAHEVKNPLSAIKTFAQYLPEKYGDKEFRDKFFRIVQSEIDRIDTIVRDLSNFAKPAPLQLKPVHLTELVEDTLTLLSDKCLKQSVAVQTSFGANGVQIQADPGQLKQVLLNLMLNSLEAMHNGGRLEVAIAPAGNQVVLRVADTGCGISQEFQAHVWDPFFTTKERGMGLGLAIVKGVVERHGGKIALSSRLGNGTTIEVILPVLI